VESGINILIPFMETMRVIDLREHVVDVPPQEVICKDNVVVVVDAIIYYQIVDGIKAVYNIQEYLTAILKLAQTNLRSIIGAMELDQTLSGRDFINAKLREELDKITDKWGVKVTRVEIKRIDPPREIQDAMAKQMKAEREKRSMILLAEGEKTSAILTAEGDKMAEINRAEGDAKAKILRAEAEAKSINFIMHSLKDSDKRYLALKYIEQLPEVAKSSNTILLPYETSEFLTALKGIKEVLDSKKQDKAGK
jgi:regulator of protease activity HflC (stomatin/prohibitin superfamily)